MCFNKWYIVLFLNSFSGLAFAVQILSKLMPDCDFSKWTDTIANDWRYLIPHHSNVTFWEEACSLDRHAAVLKLFWRLWEAKCGGGQATEVGFKGGGKLHPRWHGGGEYFYPLVLFGLVFVSWIVIKTFQTFWEVKADNVILKPCPAYWYLSKVAPRF